MPETESQRPNCLDRIPSSLARPRLRPALDAFAARGRSCLALKFVLWVAIPCVSDDRALLADSPRATPTVRVVQDVQPSVAVLYSFEGRKRGSGTASVIDPRGYLLTAKHVTATQHIALLGGRPPLRAHLVGTIPEYDLAILKLGDQAIRRPASPQYPLMGTPPKAIRLGVATEVLLGESVLNIGSPGGRGIVVTRGIVSAVNFVGNNALAMATQSSDGFDQFLQFDAASNPGNSGGPLVNMLGQQIGVVTASIRNEEGIHFAMPIETVRESIPKILNSEIRNRFVTGIAVDPQSAMTKVVSVHQDSPAHAAGLQVGDTIVSVDGRKLSGSVDWEFTKLQWAADLTVELGVQRGEQELAIDLELTKRVPTPGVASQNLKPGIQFRIASYDARIQDPLKDDERPGGPAKTMSALTASPEDRPADDHYQMKIEGLLQIEEAGAYRIGIESDDGSRLFVHDQLVADNGGNHAKQKRTGWVDLAKGFHPIRIDYYEDEGDQSLKLLLAKDEAALEPVSPELLWHVGEDSGDPDPESSEAGPH